MPREEAAFPGQPSAAVSVPTLSAAAGGSGVNGVGGGVGAIVRKGGSGGKHDMVSNANSRASIFIYPARSYP